MNCRHLIGAALVLALLGTSAQALTDPPTWNPPEPVATGATAIMSHNGADRALACDHWGNVGIAYYNGSASYLGLAYAQRVPGLGWQSWAVYTGSVQHGQYPSLAFDQHERPAISHTSESLLRYSHYDGAEWQTATVDASGGVHSSLAFDLYGRPAIAYCKSGDLCFAYDSDSNGTFDRMEVAATGVDWTELPTLAFDGSNRPMIAFLGHALPGEDYYAYFAAYGVGGWSQTTLGPATSHAVSLAINPTTDMPAVAYIERDTKDLIYTEWSGGQWDADKVDKDSAYFPSLAFDDDGNAAVAYTRNSDLYFAWFDGAAWDTDLVDATAGQRPSLAFNEYGDGWPVISYMNTTGTLYCIEDPPIVPEPATLSLLLAGGAGLVLRRCRSRRKP